MPTYLLGDVLRIFAGDTTPGRLAGKEAGQAMWLAVALIMLVPIVMLVLCLIVPAPAIGWFSLVAWRSSSCSTSRACPTPGGTTTS